MHKKNLVGFITLIFILMSVFFSFADVNLPEPTREFYVADYAGVLSEDVENFIVGTNLNYENTKEAPQIVVATVPDMQGLDVLTYSVELFEKWKIGNKDYDNGVLLLLSLKERKIRIEVGYGLEGAIPDGRAGEILDSILPDLREGNYSEGLLKAFLHLAKEVNEEYGYDDESIFSNNIDVSDINYYGQQSANSPIFTVGKIILVLIVMLLIWFDNRFLGGFLLRTLFRMMFFGRGGGGFGGGSFGGGGRSGGGGADRGF